MKSFILAAQKLINNYLILTFYFQEPTALDMDNMKTALQLINDQLKMTIRQVSGGEFELSHRVCVVRGN